MLISNYKYSIIVDLTQIQSNISFRQLCDKINSCAPFRYSYYKRNSKKKLLYYLMSHKCDIKYLSDNIKKQYELVKIIIETI